VTVAQFRAFSLVTHAPPFCCSSHLAFIAFVFGTLQAHPVPTIQNPVAGVAQVAQSPKENITGTFVCHICKLLHVCDHLKGSFTISFAFSVFNCQKIRKLT